MADCPDCENSRCWGRCWVLPIVHPISHTWRFGYEHNYIKDAQLRPPVTKMVIGSINWAQGTRIMSSFYHFAYWKLHTNDKKCLVFPVGRRANNITTFNPGRGQWLLVQQGNRRTAWSKTYTLLKAWTVQHGLLAQIRPGQARHIPRGTLNSSARVVYRAHG